MAKSTSKIENLIEELEIYIDNCKPQAFSSSKIIVNREEIEDIIHDMKKNLPEELERYRKIISNKEAIEREAQNRANELVQMAADRTNELLSENEIMMQARQKADEIVQLAIEQAQAIVDDAHIQGNAYKESAQQYLCDMLDNLHSMIYDCIDSTTRNTNKFLDSLNQVGATVKDNLDELNGTEEMIEEEVVPEEVSADVLNVDLKLQ
ncbi:MAG: vacuolar family H+-ATPase subunit H [Lachnospiraceae bacterium]|nr:vacuolar family H+-ATPase subunit H [Lachnospiraceae bacterium]MBQ8262603.1 vacuolar family H+-ATPase subunit H [Lachnospiraceae bacterium]